MTKQQPKNTISITSPQEQVTLKIAEEMNIRDMREFKFTFSIVCKVMAMYEDNNSEEILEEIQDITETENGDFRCSTCDQVNSLTKNR
tara:strand:- start:251 stop:514 length:264 start_codon:yes stop_codon:yes gene_type:complete